MDGFDPRITFSIKSLWVYNQRNHGTDPYSIAADLFVAVMRTKTMPDVSFKLVRLYVDNISGVLVAPICRLLSATLEKLSFSSSRLSNPLISIAAGLCSRSPKDCIAFLLSM